MLLLCHERNLAAERLELEIDERHATDLDGARARRVDAGEQATERRFARAGRAHHGDPFAGLEVELDPVQHVATGNVRIAHVVGAQPLVAGLVSRRLSVGRDIGDADEPRERRPAHLDLVKPREQPVDRIGELLNVEHDRRDLADRGVVGRDEPAAPREGRDDREHIGDVHRREPDRPQTKRESLGAVRVRQVRVDPASALARQAEGLDRAAAVDRLAGRAGERGIRGTLPEVATGGVAEVPASADEQDRYADDAGQRRDRAHPEGSCDNEQRSHTRDRGLGDRKPDRPGERIDVGGRARDEVADPGPLDRREGQREDPAHEVLAQLGEHLLGENE